MYVDVMNYLQNITSLFTICFLSIFVVNRVYVLDIVSSRLYTIKESYEIGTHFYIGNSLTLTSTVHTPF